MNVIARNEVMKQSKLNIRNLPLVKGVPERSEGEGFAFRFVQKESPSASTRPPLLKGDFS